jgi:hypothetical protein
VVKRQPLSMIALVAPHSGLHWGRRSCGRGRIGFARARDQRESEDRKCRKKNDQARTFHRFWPVEVHKLSVSIETVVSTIESRLVASER